MCDNINIEAMVHKFERVMNKYNKTEKKPKYYGTDNLLYRAEVHTIEAIGKNRNINVTDLASYLGITKGAVSQMIDKLIKKGMVNKKMLSHTENEVALELTEKGILAYEGHEAYHKEHYAAMSKKLEHLSQEQIKVFIDILNGVENLLDNR